MTPANGTASEPAPGPGRAASTCWEARSGSPGRAGTNLLKPPCSQSHLSVIRSGSCLISRRERVERPPKGAAPTVNAGKWGHTGLGNGSAPSRQRQPPGPAAWRFVSHRPRCCVFGPERNRITPGFSEKERGQTLIFRVVMRVTEASMARGRAHFCRLGLRTWGAWRAGGG